MPSMAAVVRALPFVYSSERSQRTVNFIAPRCSLKSFLNGRSWGAGYQEMMFFGSYFDCLLTTQSLHCVIPADRDKIKNHNCLACHQRIR